MNEEDAEPLYPDELAGIDPNGGLDEILIFGSPETRRYFLKQVAGTSAAIGLGPANAVPLQLHIERAARHVQLRRRRFPLAQPRRRLRPHPGHGPVPAVQAGVMTRHRRQPR